MRTNHHPGVQIKSTYLSASFWKPHFSSSHSPHPTNASPSANP
jgi:hypothetical protein